MWTISYRGFFIHGYCANDRCSVTTPHLAQLGPFKNLRAAKLGITRFLNGK